MTREEKIEVVESYISGLGRHDFTGVPFHEEVVYQSPISPKRTGRAAVEFLQGVFPVIHGVDIKQHIVEGEYVATVFDLHVTTGTIAIFDRFRVVDGKLLEISPYYDPRLLNQALGAS